MEPIWHILGCGSIGSMLISNAHKQHKPFRVITRRASHLKFKFKGLPGHGNSLFTLQTQDMNQIDVIEKLIIPVKAYQVEPAIRVLKPKLSHSPTLVLMHNGMGTAEVIRQIIPHSKILMATTTHGVFQEGPGSFVHTGYGETYIGSYDQNLTEFEQDGLTKDLGDFTEPLIWSDNIEYMLWHKLAINCVINPLTAIHDCKNGQLALSDFTETIDALCEEITQVANSVGVNFQLSDVKDNVYKVIQGTADNWSSMHSDIKHKRKTEIDFINGYLLRVAQARGIRASVNQLMLTLIKDLESQG